MIAVPTEFEFPFSEFGAPVGGSRIDRSDLRAFEGIIPDDYLDFLSIVGTGIWLDGLFQIVDPKKYTPLLEQIFADDPDFRPEQLVVVGTSAFGNLFIWSEKYWKISVDVLLHWVSSTYFFEPRANIPASRSLAGGLALADRSNDAFDDSGKPLFRRALKAYGPLQPDQIYAPRLHPAFGGPRKLENFRPAPALEALSIAIQAAPFILKDVLGQPPKPSRVIGG